MDRIGGMMEKTQIPDDVPIQAGLVNRTIEQSQSRVEGYNFDVRKHLLEYDDVLNMQRNKIYEQRDRLFVKDDLTEDFLEMLEAEVKRHASETNRVADELNQVRHRLALWEASRWTRLGRAFGLGPKRTGR